MCKNFENYILELKIHFCECFLKDLIFNTFKMKLLFRQKKVFSEKLKKCHF